MTEAHSPATSAQATTMTEAHSPADAWGWSELACRERLVRLSAP